MTMYEGEPRELRPYELKRLIEEPDSWPLDSAGMPTPSMTWLVGSLLATQQRTESGVLALAQSNKELSRESEYAHRCLNRLGVDSYSIDKATGQKTRLSLEARISLLEIRFGETTRELAQKNEALRQELKG